MTNTKRPNGYWNKERCLEEALKYHTRTEFKKLSRSAFGSARKNGWLNEICSHMLVTRKSNGFWNKEACEEEALKYQSRTEFQKQSASAYSRAAKEGWLDEICNHMGLKRKIKVYESKDSCAYEAIKYDTKTAFKKECWLAYKTARENGWLDDICDHMNRERRWTKKSCIEEALKYQTKQAFREGSKAYNYAYKQGWLDECCSHMQLTRKPKGYWTKERCVTEALKYQTLTEFEKNNSTATRLARKQGWLDECCGHMQPPQKPRGYWTKKRCMNEALKYQTRTEFQVSCESAYSRARKSGWLDEICDHMIMPIKPSGYWNQEKCAQEALNYKTRLSFQKSCEAAYTSARKNGWLDEICNHMIEVQKRRGYWTKDRCMREALKCETRSEFSINHNGAYKVARREGWLDEICAHMIPVGNEYLRGLYLIRNKKLNKAYIGLTSNFERRKQEHLKGSRTNASEIINEGDTEFIPLTDYVDVEKAAELELLFVKEYEKRGYILLNDVTRIGGLGGSRLKWTEDLCRAEAMKYQTRYEFQKGSRQAHAAAQRQGILDKICQHMIKPKRKVYWTRERLAKEATKYKSRTDFANGSGGAYSTARKNGWLDEICAHMNK
ncbi:GIY-YIG nuclease family protein [Vibrio alginolyticus]